MGLGSTARGKPPLRKNWVEKKEILKASICMNHLLQGVFESEGECVCAAEGRGLTNWHCCHVTHFVAPCPFESLGSG